MAVGAQPGEPRAGRPTQEAPEPASLVLGDASDQPAFPEVVDGGLSPRERELLYRVREAVDRYEPIRASRSLIQVSWRDGTVLLSGRIRSLPLKVLAERLARTAAAGRPVVCDLIADPEVVTAVATALALDPRTNLCPVQVECSLGVVRLLGQVPTSEMVAAAEEIARVVPGVALVRNELVPAPAPTPPTAAEAKAEAGAATKPIADTAYTSEPRLEPHGRDQDADRVTRPQDGKRVPVADT